MALQMNWQPTLLLQKKRKIGPPLGLKNLGNTCYLNSVLQCLTYTPPLANFCLKNQHTSLCSSDPKSENCPFCILERRIVRSLSLDSSLDVPYKIQSCITIFSKHFRFGRQEDAHEFLRYVIDACHNTCLRINASNKTTVVKEIFGGELQSQIKCLSCGAESNKIDEIMDISLDLFQSISLKDAFQRFFQPEVLDGSNKYKCNKCKQLVSARKQMSILQAPNILVIQLKRFEGIHGGKIDRSIAFEEVLVLSSYMCKESQSGLLCCENYNYGDLNLPKSSAVGSSSYLPTSQNAARDMYGTTKWGQRDLLSRWRRKLFPVLGGKREEKRSITDLHKKNIT